MKTDPPVWAIYCFGCKPEYRHYLATGLTRKEAKFRLCQLNGREHFVWKTRNWVGKESRKVVELSTRYEWQLVATERLRLVRRMDKLPFWIQHRLIALCDQRLMFRLLDTSKRDLYN